MGKKKLPKIELFVLLSFTKINKFYTENLCLNLVITIIENICSDLTNVIIIMCLILIIFMVINQLLLKENLEY